MDVCTLGIFERICVSIIRYSNCKNDHSSATEIPKDRSLHRINNKIISAISAKHARRLLRLLFLIQALIITIVMFDKLFILQQSVETCETYRQLFEGISIYDKGCSIRPKMAPNISASEFFNPINAFRPNTPPPNTNISDYCQNSSSLHNETSSNDYIIRCMKYFFYME